MSKTFELPVLPLADDVVLPGMVAPITLDPEAQAAVDAAQSAADSRLILVPRIDGAMGADGLLAVIEQVGRLPNGEPAAVVRGLQRVRILTGVSGAGAALWVQATSIDETPATDRTRELATSYKAVVVSILQQRGAWQVVDNVQRMSDPSLLSDTAGYAPYLDLEQKLWLLGNPDVDERLEKLTEWGRNHVAELAVSDRIRDDVREGMEKSQREFLLRQQLAAIRKELGEDEPDGADDYRSRVEKADLPDKVREAALREVGKLERGSDQSPEAGWIRTWLDTVLELALVDAHDGQHRRTWRAGGSGRRPRGSGRREGPDRGTPRCPGAPGRTRHGARRRPRQRCRARAGRSARCRQDIVGGVGRSRTGPELRPGLAGWGPGRGGDPGSPTHLRGRPSWPGRPRDP